MILTPKQNEANRLLAGPQQHTMLFGGSRCLTGDAILDGQTRPIWDLARIGKPVRVLTTRGYQWADAPFCKGRGSMLTVETVLGRRVTVTPDHRFWSGDAWRVASDLRCSDQVAVRLSSRGPLASNLARDQSESLEGGPYSKGKFAGFQAHCFGRFRRYGQRFRQLLAGARVCHASSLGVLGHSPWCVRAPTPESDIHIGQIYLPASGDSLCGQRPFPRATSDDSPSLVGRIESDSRACGQTCEPSQGSRLAVRLFRWMCGLWRLAPRLVDIALYRCALLLGFSYDIPSADGYELDRVCRVTETPELDYYTLHVPVTEQFFANGILHHNSGKTFILTRAVATRALKAAKSRHCILRFRLGHIKSSMVMDTYPKVMSLCFPDVRYELNKSDLYSVLENGSEIWFGGLDDSARVEKILGNEYCTLYFNECSQIPWSSRNVAMTRLAQLVEQKIQGQPPRPLPLRAYYDENPPDKGHWTYRLFKTKVDPESKQALPDPENYACMQINPNDNVQNLPADYLKTLCGLSARLQKRFLEGEFRDASPNALFTEETIDTWRLLDDELPEMLRIVVAVDPSGADDTDNIDNDEIGIVVCGLGIDGNGYLLEDLTCKAGPATWGRVATQAFERHQADIVVAEVNYGGAMVKNVIRSARPMTPFRAVTASRGKHVRAEPVAAMMETGKIRFAGIFRGLEDELCAMTTHGYTGENSPNRADAFVWGMSELFPDLLKPKVEKQVTIARPAVRGFRF